MKITLENETLEIAINEKGAELNKLYAKKTNIDYLWRPKEPFWQRQSPILFPIVGRLKEDQFIENDTKYTLPKHGFARDSIFTVLTQTQERITLAFNYSDETLAIYPFKFSLEVTYSLKKNKVIVHFNVVNNDTKKMYFSLGAHPAFSCTMKPEDAFEDYYIAFDTAENASQLFLNKTTGFRNGKSKNVRIKKTLPLSHKLFENDALIFENIQSKKVSLRSNNHENGIHMHLPKWQYLAFWTQSSGAPFICFEPWMGINDADTSSQILSDKTGIIHLEPEQSYENHYTLEVF